MHLQVDQLSGRDRYKLLIGAVVPRPIAWVSTMDANGQLNLAPFSYFTAASANPMTLIFCAGHLAGGQEKDTLRNIRAVPEFVVNMSNQATATQMSATAALLASDSSEFEYANLTPASSRHVRVPRVAEAPIAFECTLQQIVPLGADGQGGHAIFGTVVSLYVRDDIYQDGRILVEPYAPIGRLAGNDYVRVTDRFTIDRDTTNYR